MFPCPRRAPAILLLILPLLVLSRLAWGFPQRVVSVNLCTDLMVATLAPERLISVTWLSHEPVDLEIQPTLLRIPVNHAGIEEILALRPDLVVGGEYGAPGLPPMLARAGVPWRALPLPRNLDDLYDGWHRVAQWLGNETMATAVTRTIAQGLQNTAEQLRPRQLRALMLNPGGWIAGPGNFQHAFLEAIGLRNVAAEAGIRDWGEASLEQIVHWAPDILIILETRYDGQARATRWLQHPLLTRVLRDRPPVRIDAAWLSCGTVDLLKAAEAVATSLQDSQAGARP